MYLKLQYTSDRTVNSCFRALTAIFKDKLITDTATLQSRSASWNPDVIGFVDFENSEVVRTVDESKVNMRYSKWHSAGYVLDFVWMAEFDVYDNPGEKWYLQARNIETSASTHSNKWAVGSVLTGGAFNATEFEPSRANTYTAAGSQVHLLTSDTTNNFYSSTTNLPTTGNIRCMWAYVNNDCLIIFFTLKDTTNNGMPVSYTSAGASTTMAGPYMFGHYERWDYWNKSSNGILPVMYHNINRNSHYGYGQDANRGADWSAILNVLYGTVNDVGPFKVFSTIDARPSTTPSWPLQRWQLVNHGVGLRSDYSAALNWSAQGSGATATSVNNGAVIHTTANTRFISEDLTSATFAMLPLTWQHSVYNNAGGSFTARSGVYLFNGEYFPGDEYTYSGKTYNIWPTYAGYTGRVGVAIPKE